jgi:myxalamid-type polyketide synthase MxaF
MRLDPDAEMMPAASTLERPKVAFAYGARESILPEVVRLLLTSTGIVRDVLLRCDAYVERRLGCTLRAALARGNALPEFLLEPALTASQIALTAGWQARGEQPQAIVARCGGEFAAAYARGVLSLESAMEVACRVGRLIERGLGSGRMLVVRAGLAEIERLQQTGSARFHVVSDNAESTTVVALATDELEAVEQLFAAAGVAWEPVPSAIAPHCALVDVWRDELLRPLDAAPTTNKGIPYFSAAAPDVLAQGLPDVDHFWRVARQPVLFGRALDAAIAAGYRIFVEIGTHPGLRKMIEERAAMSAQAVITLPSLRAGKTVDQALDAGAAELRRLGDSSAPAVPAAKGESGSESSAGGPPHWSGWRFASRKA